MLWVANNTLVLTPVMLVSLGLNTRTPEQGSAAHASGDDTETGSTHPSILDWLKYTYLIFLDDPELVWMLETTCSILNAIQGPGDGCRCVDAVILQLVQQLRLACYLRRARVRALVAAKGLPDRGITSEVLVKQLNLDFNPWHCLSDTTSCDRTHDSSRMKYSYPGLACPQRWTVAY